MENFTLNHQILLWIYAGAHPQSWQIMLGTFAAGYLGFLFPVILVYQGYSHRDRRALVMVIFTALLLAVVASEVIQHFLYVNRPFVDGLVTNLIAHSPNSSFPSDHALVTSTVAFGFILGRVYKLGFFLLILALIVGWGRVYMGVHYPLDIVAGFGLGFVCAFVCVKGLLGNFQKALLYTIRQ